MAVASYEVTEVLTLVIISTTTKSGYFVYILQNK